MRSRSAVRAACVSREDPVSGMRSSTRDPLQRILEPCSSIGLNAHCSLRRSSVDGSVATHFTRERAVHIESSKITGFVVCAEKSSRRG